MTIGSVLIANRGEIAVRIVRAAKTLGIRAVQAHSAADRDMLAVRLADEAVEIGPAAAAKSYLNIAAVVDAALRTGAEAVHPGYGFLAENAAFARAVEAAGLIFIGPTPAAIELLGDKVEARKTAAAAGVPTVPGSDGRIDDIDEAEAAIACTGFPALIKAAAGGGGRGIRVVNNLEEFRRLFPQASSEAKAAFGDGGLYVEKLVERARHIEVQILGDGKNVVHCYERECSLQRRRQKVWEEAPSLALPPEARERLCASAVAIAKAVSYRGAGTVEFLFDEETGAYYFLEVNTRIQVEHPVTEMITGVDLVAEMFRIAGGEPLSVRQADIAVSGHAIECRINAEDPFHDFMPGPGVIGRLVVPDADGVRFDTMLYEGYGVPPFYDSLLGKLVVHGADRRDCLARLRKALAGLVIEGVPTTIPLHQALADDEAVARAAFHTRFLESWIGSEFAAPAARLKEFAS